MQINFRENQDTELERYETAARDGNVLLGMDTPEQMVDTASDILNHHSPVDLVQHGTAAQSTSGMGFKTADPRYLQTPAETDARSLLGANQQLFQAANRLASKYGRR